MEHDVAGIEVIKAARAAAYHPAVALLTAFPVAEEDWQEMGADQLLVKPMHTRILLQQIEHLIASHEQKLAQLGLMSAATDSVAVKKAPKKIAAKNAGTAASKKPAATKKNTVTKKTSANPKKGSVAKAKPLAKKAKPSRKA
jgi:DNA-binding response OmpR family regulator